jgi:hypothetical protein
MTSLFLPGMEDMSAPCGWEDALDRLEFKPARRLLLRALRVLAGSTRPECSPSNRSIRSAIAGLGREPPGDREITALLNLLEFDDHLIHRCENDRTGSQRRIHFLFLQEGADDLRPWPQTTCAPGRRRPAPLGADDLRPPSAQVQAIQPPAPAAFSPLNSIQNSEKEKTLTLPAREPYPEPQAVVSVAPEPETLTLGAPPDPEPERPAPVKPYRGDNAPPLLRTVAILERFRRRIEQGAIEEAQTPQEAPATAPVVKTIAPPPSPHLETVDRLRRLADPCGKESVEAVAAQIAKQLDDEHSMPFHRRTCERIQRRELPLKIVVAAYKQARFGTGRCPGAIYTGFITKHAPPRSAQEKPTPGATRQSPPGIGQGQPFPTPSGSAQV